jgi:hypothetical protein
MSTEAIVATCVFGFLALWLGPYLWIQAWREVRFEQGVVC